MKLRLSLVTFVLLLAALFAACGPSQEELDATSTANAASAFATQTAEAPTVTPTPTETPTPTNTPTATPTEAPTDTPEAATTADAAAFLEGALPTGDDLPQGFQELPTGLMDEQLGEGVADSLGPTAMFMNINTGEFVATVLTPLSSGLQRSLFEQQMQDPEQLANMIGGMQLGGAEGTEVEYESLTVEDIGEAASGVQAKISMAGLTMVVDTVMFQSGDVGAVVGVMHPDDVEPEVDVIDLAELIEGRLSQLSEDQNGS